MCQMYLGVLAMSMAPAGVHCPPQPSDPTISAACSKDTHLWAEGARVA